MSGRNSPLYCTLTSIAMQGHRQSIDKRHDELGIQLKLLHWVYDRMSVDEGKIKSWMDVKIIMEICPITIPMIRAYK